MKRSKSGLARLIAVLGAGFVITGLACGAPAAAPIPSAPIKIGAILSTTGPLGAVGSEELAGAQILVDEINAKGGINGRRIELVHADDESKPEVAISGVKRLIQQEKVVGLIGPASVAVSASVQAVLEENKMPAVSAVGVIGPMNPYLFTVIPISKMVDTMMAWARERGSTKVGLIALAGAQVETVRNSTVPDIERLATLVSIEVVQASDTDVTPALAKLRGAGAQVVYSTITGAQSAIVAKNFKQMNYPGIFITHLSNATDNFVQLSGEAADILNTSATKIIVYKDLPGSDPAKTRLTEFAKKYVAKTGKEPTVSAAGGHDMVLSLTEAIRVAGDNPQKIRDALENQTGVQGLNGVINRSAKEHNGVEPEWLIASVDPVTKRYGVKK